MNSILLQIHQMNMQCKINQILQFLTIQYPQYQMMNVDNDYQHLNLQQQQFYLLSIAFKEHLRNQQDDLLLEILYRIADLGLSIQNVQFCAQFVTEFKYSLSHHYNILRAFYDCILNICQEADLQQFAIEVLSFYFTVPFPLNDALYFIRLLNRACSDQFTFVNNIDFVQHVLLQIPVPIQQSSRPSTNHPLLFFSSLTTQFIINTDDYFEVLSTFFTHCNNHQILPQPRALTAALSERAASDIIMSSPTQTLNYCLQLLNSLIIVANLKIARSFVFDILETIELSLERICGDFEVRRRFQVLVQFSNLGFPIRRISELLSFFGDLE